MTREYKIAVIGGDGIGPEIMSATLSILNAAGARIAPVKVEIGEAVYRRLTTPARRPYRTRDGYLSVIVYTDRQWDAFLRLAGRPVSEWT